MSMHHLIRRLEELRSPWAFAKRFDIYVYESNGEIMGWKFVNAFTYLKDAQSFAKELQQSGNRVAIFRQNRTKEIDQNTFYPDDIEKIKGVPDTLGNDMLYKNGGTLIKVFKAK
jgi:hypothetical protein